MEKQQIIDEIKKQISEAETEKALEQLQSYIASHENLQGLAEDIIQTQSQFEKIKKDETFGNLTYEEAKKHYSLIHQQLFHVLGEIERGPKAGFVQKRRQKNIIGLSIAGVLILVLAGVLWVKKSGGEPSTTNIQTCPSGFSGADPAAFKTLVLPFLDFENEKASVLTSNVILQQLDNFSSKHQLKILSGIYNSDFDLANYPTNSTKAKPFADTCQANLLIWGSREKGPQNEEIILTRYKFFNLGEQFHMSRLVIDEENKLDTVSTLTQLATEGTAATNDITTAIGLLFGIIAHELGNHQVAIQALETLPMPDDTTTALVQGAFLADSYVKTQEFDKAKTTLDTLLGRHPNYFLGLVNRAAVNQERNDFTAAIDDYSKAGNLKPADSEVQIQKVKAYINNKQLDKAQQNLDTLEKRNLPTNHREKLTPLRRKLDNMVTEEKSRKESALESARTNPNNINNLTQAADASKNLGDFSDAIRIVDRVLQLDPKNEEAQLIKIDILQRSGAKLETLINAVKNAEIQGVETSKILKRAPMLKDAKITTKNN